MGSFIPHQTTCIPTLLFRSDTSLRKATCYRTITWLSKGSLKICDENIYQQWRHLLWKLGAPRFPSLSLLSFPNSKSWRSRPPNPRIDATVNRRHTSRSGAITLLHLDNSRNKKTNNVLHVQRFNKNKTQHDQQSTKSRVTSNIYQSRVSQPALYNRLSH